MSSSEQESCIKNLHGIEIDYSRDNRLNEATFKTLKDRYLTEDEKSPQEAFARAATAYADNPAHAQRIYDYASKGWFMFSTPILSNGGTERGLPISCFLNMPSDSTEGITDHNTENVWLTVKGGGIGGFWGKVRSDGAKIKNKGTSTGVIPYIKTIDSLMLAWSQGASRRGSYAAYLDIAHPEIEEFINIRKPTGGDMNRKSLNLHHAVIIPDEFMKKVETGGKWDLIDPNTKQVVKTVDARNLWMEILNLRVESGEPYIMFKDAVDNAAPEDYKKKQLEINSSNLCSEILIPTSSERTAVCCLSSVNLEFFDEWKDTDMVRDLIRFLDNVLQSFIDNAPPSMHKAINGAKNGRDLGLGAMGFHAFLQKKNVPFESAVAKSWNKKMFSEIKKKAEQETLQLAIERGPAPDSVDGKRRNIQLLAVAPNASSSIICNTSPSIEPIRANVFNQKTLSGTLEIKNNYLDEKITDYLYKKHLSSSTIVTEEDKDRHDKEYQEIWSSIVRNSGSVQHLEFLSDIDKDVFKTATEIDQMWLIEHAADRQEFICQSQSLNLFFVPVTKIEKTIDNIRVVDPGEYKWYNKLKRAIIRTPLKHIDKQIESEKEVHYIDAKYLHDVHMMAWKKGLKTLYYLRSEAANRVENVSVKIERSNVVDTQSYSPTYEETTCIACEG